MRDRFEAQLNELNRDLIEMGALVERAIARATQALEGRDVAAAKQVILGDDLIDHKEKQIESECLRMFFSQQPVARDLRQVSTALKIITDIERIGDHAADISELCVYLSEQDYVQNMARIPQLAEATMKMVTESIDAFVRRDEALAREVVAYDDVVDALFLQAKQDLIALVHRDVDLGEQAFDLLQIAKYYERIGDHAVNIAEWVIFSITGMHKNIQVL
jgi:phosphate transport system protein